MPTPTPNAMPRKRIHVYIDPDLLARFKSYFPMDNGLSWLLETALKASLDQVDGTTKPPEAIRDAVRAAILYHHSQRRANGTRDEDRQDAGTTDNIAVEPIGERSGG